MMSSLGSGMQALSIAMRTAMPPYDRVAMTYTQNPPSNVKIALTIGRAAYRGAACPVKVVTRVMSDIPRGSG
jgi:hypothetical protein